jgi:hypothetical protein
MFKVQSSRITEKVVQNGQIVQAVQNVNPYGTFGTRFKVQRLMKYKCPGMIDI